MNLFRVTLTVLTLATTAIPQLSLAQKGASRLRLRRRDSDDADTSECHIR